MKARPRKRTDKKTGETIISRKYYLYFRDHLKREQTLTGFTDKTATEELGRKIKKLVEDKMAGVGLDVRSIEFIRSCPAAIMTKLVKWKIVDEKYTACAKPILKLLEDWRTDTQEHCRTTAHPNNFYSKVKRLIEFCDWKSVYDINIQMAKKWLKYRRDEEKAATETRNHDIEAMRAFCNWLADSGLINSPHPLQKLKTRTSKGDRRRIRRPLEPDDFKAMIKHTATNAAEHHNLSGPVRALCYKLCIRTGMRHKEMRSLTPESFKMNAKPPVINLKGGDAKNEEDFPFTIDPNLVEEIRKHLETISPGVRVFDMPEGTGGAMLTEDLRAAGIDIEDSYGRIVDFHALRYTFCNDMIKAGVPESERQRQMRHSSLAVLRRYEDRFKITPDDFFAKLPSLAVQEVNPEILEKAYVEGPEGPNYLFVLEDIGSMLGKKSSLSETARYLAEWHSRSDHNNRITGGFSRNLTPKDPMRSPSSVMKMPEKKMDDQGFVIEYPCSISPPQALPGY